MAYFHTEKIEDSITCIRGITDELMYLIEGENKAVLIDTGLGYGNLKTYVDNLTSLPYDVILSHGHLDHGGGAFLYKNVYLNSNDIPIHQHGSSVKHRKAYVESLPIDITIDNLLFVEESNVNYLPLKDGDVFDLGGITIEAISTPGHTLGSFSFLIKEKQILFTGDACSGSTFLFLEGCLSIEEYQKTIEKLLKRENEYDKVLISHISPVANKSMIKEVNLCCQDILNGTDDQDVIELPIIGTAYVARKLNPQGFRMDGIFGNVFYRKDNIYNK